ncbi:MAG: UvrD-helicase domain-containing protein [Proteobacteria bacterium]|nr:UvrD-helicase domain-containing protein [Pseudomonadota bacterium]
MKLDLTGKRAALDLREMLTDEQIEATRFDREIVVTAGAGAGKTHTLALRYVALLLDLAVRSVEKSPRNPRPAVDAVLVLTFTEKAAEEMADRCYRRLLALSETVRQNEAALAIYGDGFGAGLSAAVDHLLDTFDRATISTFHSFCGQILREFPAETHTDPAYEALDPLEAVPLRSRACEAALGALGDRDPNALSLLLDAMGNRQQTLSSLAEIVGRRGELHERLEAHAAGEVGIDDLIDKSLPTLESTLGWLQRRGFDLVDGIVQTIGGRSDRKPYLRMVALRDRGRPDDAIEAFEYYRELMDILSFPTRDGWQAREVVDWRFMGQSRNWAGADRWQAEDALRGMIRGLGTNLPKMGRQARTLPCRADEVLLDVLRIACRVAIDAIHRLEQAFDERHVIDFDEMLLRAVRAVDREPALREALQRRYRYLMVDEFQDTDTQQWSMVRAIGRPAGAPLDRIFLVGDAKQAIYRFRGGDVTVFRTATEELSTEPVVLHSNFRSRTVLIDWFNAVFRTILGPPREGLRKWEAPYHELVAGRGEDGGSAVLYVHDTDGLPGTNDEAEGIARLIAGQILPGHGRYAGEQFLDRAVHPAPPVAILLRSRTHLRLFEQALQRHRVPFIVAKGTGFWSRPEILDLANTVHALATDDPMSIVGALRSPLFGVPDQELQDWLKPAESAFEAIRDWLADGACGPRLAEARTRYRHLIALRDRLPVSSLLREIAQVAAAPHLWALEDDWGAAEQNALRLIEMAATFDGKGPEGLQDVADWFLGQIAVSAKEAEAAVTPDRARVVLMTVHASKGLEFPVVVVPDLHRRVYMGSDRTRIGRIRCGSIEVACPVPDPTAQVRDTARPGLLDAIRVQTEDEELAEHRRLLYVAVTRTRDHLVLVGQRAKPTGNPKTWMELVQMHHTEALLSRDGLEVLQLEEALDLEPAPLLPPDALPPPPTDARETLARIEPPAEVEISPSSLDLYTEQPKTWYRTHVLGIPESAATRQDRGRAIAAARGEVIHSLLEDDLAHDLDVAKARWAARAHAEGLSPGEVSSLFRNLRKHLVVAAEDKRLRRALDATGYAELNFRLAHGDVILRGQIDRLWLDREADEWVVLDYKSERMKAKGAMFASMHHASQLLAYGWAARRVLRAHGDARTVRGELYYTETGEFFAINTWDDADFAGFEALLTEVGHFAQKSWEEVRKL